MIRSVLRAAVTPDVGRAPTHIVASAVYVGPPDRVSNLRPILYGDDGRSQKAAATHPYSLSEFSQPSETNAGSYASATGSGHGGVLKSHYQRMLARLEAAQLQARLQSIWLDQFNERFWTDNNTRFQHALDEAGGAAQDADLVSRFYREWLSANAGRLRAYNRMLWDATFSVIGAQAHFRVLYGYTRAFARVMRYERT